MNRHPSKAGQWLRNDCSMASKSSVEGAEGVGDVVIMTVNWLEASVARSGTETISCKLMVAMILLVDTYAVVINA